MVANPHLYVLHHHWSVLQHWETVPLLYSSQHLIQWATIIVGIKLKPLVVLHITTGIPHEVVFLLTLVQVKKHLFHQLSHPRPHNRTMRFLNRLPHVRHLCPPHLQTLEENNRIIAVTYHKRWCFCLVRRHWWRWRYHYFTIGVLLYVTLQKEEKKHC